MIGLFTTDANTMVMGAILVASVFQLFGLTLVGIALVGVWARNSSVR